jgi:hypothetical protein
MVQYNEAEYRLKTIFTVVRNEMPFLLEWVAFHKLLNFDRMVIYSNRSSDGTHELLDELASYSELDYVFHEPDDEPPQGHAAKLFLNSNLVKDGDYVLWLDADEFLNIKTGEGCIDDLIAWMRGASGVCIPWRVFGDSGLVRFAGRFIGESYVLAESADLPLSRNCKTLVRLSDDLDRLRIHAPLMKPDFWSRGGYFRSANGRRLDTSIPEIALWAQGGPLIANAADMCYDFVQINHYQVRSPAAFHLKYARGNGAAKGYIAEIERQRYAATRYDIHNFNLSSDTSILRFAPRLDIELKRLRKIGRVDEIQSQAEARFKAFEAHTLATLSQPGNGVGHL